MTSNDTTELVDELRRRIADPATVLNRTLDGVSVPTESAAYWAARAVVAGLEDGSLGYVPAAEVEQLRYERRLLGAARIVLDQVAESRFLSPSEMEKLRNHAAITAQRIVDEIGHPVTDEPALGPGLREQVANLTAELARHVGALQDAVRRMETAEQELDALDNRVRLLLITPDGDREDHETITVAELRDAINGVTAPVPGSSHRAQEPDGRRSFEDLLADPHEQFDSRGELLASVAEYANAPSSAARGCGPACGEGHQYDETCALGSSQRAQESAETIDPLRSSTQVRFGPGCYDPAPNRSTSAGESQASEPADWRQAYELKVQDLARETARVGKLIAAVEAAGHRACEDCRTRYCGICRALREITGEPAAPKLAQGGRESA